MSILEAAEIPPYPDIIRSAQDNWQNLRGRPWERKYQNVTFPQRYVRLLYESVLATLPIDQTTREQIGENHPLPVIGIGAGLDDRLRKKIFKPDYFPNNIYFADVPLDDESVEILINGAFWLNEAITSLVMIDVLTKLTEHSPPILKRLLQITRTHQTMKSLRREDQINSIKEALYPVLSDEELVRVLKYGLFTDQLDHIEELLKDRGYGDYSHFLLTIGQRIGATDYHGEPVKQPFTLPVHGKYLRGTGVITIYTPSLMILPIEALLFGGYAKIIQMAPLLLLCLPAISILSSQAYYELQFLTQLGVGIPVHEMIHYLSEREDWKGLIPAGFQHT